MDNPGPPVALYVQDHPETALAVVCDGCRETRVYPWEKIVHRMLQLRLNPVMSGVHTLGRLIKEPCPKCRGKVFSTKVHWPESGPKVLSYAQAKKRL